MHKRLSIKSLIMNERRPMFTKFQDFYTLGVEVCFTRIWEFTWRVSDCEGFLCTDGAGGWLVGHTDGVMVPFTTGGLYHMGVQHLFDKQPCILLPMF